MTASPDGSEVRVLWQALPRPIKSVVRALSDKWRVQNDTSCARPSGVPSHTPRRGLGARDAPIHG
jgi:hypothetical protein